MYHYHAFGLKLASTIALPELAPGSAPPDVVVSVTRSAEAARGQPYSFDGSGDQIVLRLQDMRFTVRDGRTIDVVVAPETAEIDIRIWLLGTVMAILLHQRGYFPLHANAVRLPGGGAAAFCGTSGAGKSTMAALLDRAGFQVLGDDLCAIRFGADGRPALHAGIPRLKLWAETLGLLGRGTDGLERVASDLLKFHVPLQPQAAQGSLDAVPLMRLYLLDRATSESEPLIAPLRGAAAAAAALDNAFRWGLGQTVAGGDSRLQFDQAMGIARHAAVFRLARRWGADQLFDEAAEIAAHLSSPLTHSAADGGVAA